MILDGPASGVLDVLSRELYCDEDEVGGLVPAEEFDKEVHSQRAEVSIHTCAT